MLTKGLIVNASKTEVVLFTRKYKTEGARNLVIEVVKISIVEKAKYIGVILGKRINWNFNLEERRKKPQVRG